MFTIDGVRKFHGWTHASLTLLLDHLATIPASDYVKDLPNFGFATVRDQVIHAFNCEGLWVHALQGVQYTDCNPTDYPAVTDAIRMQQNVSRRTQEYLSNLTNEQLNTNTELHFSDGDKVLRTPALILHHILTHAFHHKGQIAAMCRELGHPTPDTDLNQFE